MLTEIEIVVYTALFLALAILSLLGAWGAVRGARRPRRLDAERLLAGGALVAPHDDQGRLP